MNTLIVIGPLNYPKGGAPTNRIHLYCKAMMKIGANAMVLSLSAPFSTKQNFPSYGRYQGVPYFYTAKNYIREKSFLKRNVKRLYGIINALFLLRKIALVHNDCAILFYSTTFHQELIFKLFAVVKSIPTLRDISEAPKFLRNRNKLYKIQLYIHKTFRLKLYNSIIVISRYLNNYYAGIYPQEHIKKIPILVDLKRFNNLIYVKDLSEKTITYIGYMGGNKDGLDDLLDAFSLVIKEVPGIKLNIIGTGPKYEIAKFKSKIEELRLAENVELVGQIESSEIPQRLAKSTLLVLARPDSIRAQAGFPTKLGEYLAAKRPVVITSTGEIPNYLKDGESAYLAKPGDIKHIADKIILALNDQNSESIAKKGYDVALNNFDYRKYGDILNELIDELNSPDLLQPDIKPTVH